MLAILKIFYFVFLPLGCDLYEPHSTFFLASDLLTKLLECPEFERLGMKESDCFFFFLNKH